MSGLLYSGLDEVVRQWLYPQAGDRLLQDAIGQYRHTRVSALNRLLAEGAMSNASAEYVARELVSRPDLMEEIPAQAGAFAICDTEFSCDLDVARGWTLAATELLVRAGERVALHITTSGPLRLPVGGLLLRGSPDAGWHLEGHDHVLTIRNGSGSATITYTQCGTAVEADSIVTHPRESFAGICIDQHWDLLRAPLKYLPVPIDVAGPPLDQTAATILKRALAMHQLAAPDLLHQMDLFPVFIVPLQQRPGVVRYSQTIKQLPGVIYTNFYDAFEVLDLLVHEFAHSRLIVLENVESLMSRPSEPVVVPWRPDVRTSHGLVHGIYVFHQVATVFTQLFETFEPSDRGQRRLAVIWTCIEKGLEQLDSVDSGLTALGSQLMREVRQDQTGALSTVRAQSEDAYNWSNNVVTKHLEQAGRPDSSGPWFLAV